MEEQKIGIFRVFAVPSMKRYDAEVGLDSTWNSPVAKKNGVGAWLLALALKQLPIGTAYAIWTGIGAAGTVAAGMCFFGEPVSVLRIVSLLAVIGGIIGLKLAH